MGDVLEYLVDGTSGLAPGGVDGKAMVAGVCSKGQPGKAYLVGPRSDLSGLLGVGPLVDRLRDVLATAGQEAVVVAVPVRGQQGGYISAPVWSGGNGKYPSASVSGVPQKNADIVVEVTAAGQVGTATVKVSTDGGATFDRGHAPAARERLAGRRAAYPLPRALRCGAGGARRRYVQPARHRLGQRAGRSRAVHPDSEGRRPQ